MTGQAVPTVQIDNERTRVTEWRFAPGASVPADEYAGGLELFVLDGTLEDGEAAYPAGTWARFPAGGRIALRSTEGATAYVKTGHLAG